MKNLVKIGIITCSLLLVVGCGNKKTLKCSLSDNSDVVNGRNTVSAEFKDEKITKITISIENDFSDDYIKYIDVIGDSLDAEYSDLGSKKGVTYKLQKSGSKVTATITGDFSKMDNETKSKLIFGDSETYEVNKEQLENQGYTCK